MSILSLVLARAASGELVSHDDFDSYTPGIPANGLNSGGGWNGPWDARSGVTVSAENILPGGTGEGRCLKVAANSDNIIGRQVLPDLDAGGTDYYVSFYFRLGGQADGTTLGGTVYSGWQAEDDNPSISVDNIGFTGVSGKAGARVNNLSSSFTSSLVYGRTYRFVIRYSGWDGTRYTSTRVWLDPQPSDETSTNSAVTQERSSAGGGSSGFRGLRVRSFGLSASAFYLFDEVRVTTSWAALWPDLPDVPADGTFVPVEGPDWVRHAHTLEVEPGGVFDFSSLLDAPAGKHGRLRATADGHFEFENRPGQRVRFWGVNLAFSANYLTQAGADLLAARLARSGYNSVRFHHFDGTLVMAGADSWVLDPARLAQLDYLFHALKQKGIYINIDLFSTRGFSAAEAAAFGVSSAAEAGSLFKALVPIEPAAFDSWKKFATNLLTHVNPHTGLSWAEDAALAGICPVNENPLHRLLGNAGINARYNAAFDASRTAPPGETADQRAAAYARFIFERNAASDAALFAHLRSLNTKALLTGANYTIAQGLTHTRRHYDYVDCHQYWDHPSFPGAEWSLPISFSQGSATSSKGYMPGRMAGARIFGKPFVTTEVRYCRPNRYRSEGAVLLPAYASLQDWDGIYTFHYSTDASTVFSGGVDNYFALANDPIGLIGDRLGALLFIRGDITPATRAVAFAAREEEALVSLTRELPADFRQIGLVTRIGSLPGHPVDVLAANPGISAAAVGPSPALSPLPARSYLASMSLPSRLMTDGVIPAGSFSGNRVTSETGQIQLDAGGPAVRVVTPRSELFVLSPQTQLEGDRVRVTNGGTFGTVSVVSLAAPEGTGLSLGTARRILVTHLTDSLATGMRFADESRKILQNWGTLPHLIRSGDATLSLDLPAGGWRAWSVDAAGARTTPHPLFPASGGRWSTTLSMAAGSGSRLAYELEKVDFSGMEQWRSTHFGIPLAVGKGADLEDPDQDGLANLLEYALGGHPLEPARTPLPTTATAGQESFSFSFRRVADPALTYRVQVAADLTAPDAWTDIWTSSGSQNEAGMVTVPVAKTGFPRRFIRLHVSCPAGGASGAAGFGD